MNNNTTRGSILDSYESSEIALMDSFKAAALKVTTLYKDSLVQNRKAYVSGYQQALQDLYEFISSHPKTTVSQQDTIMSPTEHGLLPVEDLLEYARRQNNRLTSEIGMDQSSSPQQQVTSSTNIPPSFDTPIRSQQQQQDSNDTVQSQTAQLRDTGSATHTTTITPERVSDGVGVTVKDAFHPFQIDPGTQFTFSLPVGQQSCHNTNNIDHHRNHRNHHHYYHNSDNFYNNNNNMNQNREHINDMNQDDDINDHHHGGNSDNRFFMDGTTPMEGLKRRLTQQELTFMGRTLNNMNIDGTWNESTYKRRFKKDD